ncbi:hypothetical protein ElyMa_005001100 [Elysia marginata]|uniref:Secreted protein n=1 Tax=Elysia marginata TaxID=1093978 RepID=A0AAV4J9P8_9GAST|nr:hypothetical protein ElyMa_005001100 [Elysia marginata]
MLSWSIALQRLTTTTSSVVCKQDTGTVDFKQEASTFRLCPNYFWDLHRDDIGDPEGGMRQGSHRGAHLRYVNVLEVHVCLTQLACNAGLLQHVDPSLRPLQAAEHS